MYQKSLVARLMSHRWVLLLFCFGFAGFTVADDDLGEVGSGRLAFAQLGQELPDANSYRTASGAPGHAYWQQRADYDITAVLDAQARQITASAVIGYTNNSPDILTYLWLQLDQNRFRPDSLDQRSRTVTEDRVSYGTLREQQSYADNQYGYEGLLFRDSEGDPMQAALVDTMARLDLSNPLLPGERVEFTVEWRFNILEEVAVGSRGGFEYFEKTDTQLFFLAQWFPRLAAYTDYAGWQNKAFLGRGEFTLEFGNYEVALTVPDNHIVSATGVLANPDLVLSPEQRKRLEAVDSKKPRFIVTPQEALANEQTQPSGEKTWIFKAENVRDFAWSSSAKFVWDAMLHEQPGAQYDSVLAMSFYPNEAEPVWSQYSTQAVVHTLDVYSRFSFDYPYPTAQSVNTWESGGMEYPMITFNGYRPDPPRAKPEKPESAETRANEARAYSRRIKYGLIGVIIHEIGHIYFPMIVNSDERQWTWMDEGLNTFLEYMAELEWEEDYPAFRDDTNILDYIPGYMTSKNQVPVMTQSDSILQFGPNAYVKPAAALTVLRETVMGRELFDFAFREYSQRWKFKRPTPADFFRTMEDASGVDLDWFWRAWFYGTEHVDVALNEIRVYRLKSGDPDIDAPLDRIEAAQDNPEPVTVLRNRDEGRVPRESRYQELEDLYSDNDRFTVTNKDRNEAQKAYKKLETWEQAALARALEEDPLFYFLDFVNVGGVPSPIPLEIYYEDGSSRNLMIPAEIWRRNANTVTHRLIEAKPIAYVQIDGKHQTADTDYANNRFPPEIRASRLKTYKRDRKTRNLMADLLVELKKKSGEGAEQGENVELEAVQD